MKLSEKATAGVANPSKQQVALVKRKGKKRRAANHEPLACPECGCLIEDEDDGSHSRDLQHHRLFFKEIALATKNWPKDHPEIDPMGNHEVLRGWLLTEAGHCDILDHKVSVEMAAADTATLVAFMNAGFQAANKAGRYGRIVERSGFYLWLIARSISWDEEKGIGESEFRRVHDRVRDVYAREGFDMPGLLEEARLEAQHRERP